MSAPPLWLLTGHSGLGKTTFCDQLAHTARHQGLQVAGLLSPSWIEAGQKAGIYLQDLRSREQRPLAYATPNPKADLRLGQWYFDPRVFGWGNRQLENSLPCDLLIVDELGPMEFTAGIGLIAAFELLAAGIYRAGCVVIRPSLLGEAHARWPWAKVLPVEDASIPKILSALHG